MEYKYEIKRYLEKTLLKENALWSFERESCHDLSDKDLIKYVLIHLDLEDVELLFKIYPKNKIKRVLLDELVPQGEYLTSMNHCLAVIYFDIKRSSQYLKTMEPRHFNKIAQCDTCR